MLLSREAPALSALAAVGFSYGKILAGSQAVACRGQLQHAAAHTQEHPWDGSSSIGPRDKVPAVGTLAGRARAGKRRPCGSLKGAWNKVRRVCV